MRPVRGTKQDDKQYNTWELWSDFPRYVFLGLGFLLLPGTLRCLTTWFFDIEYYILLAVFLISGHDASSNNNIWRAVVLSDHSPPIECGFLGISFACLQWRCADHDSRLIEEITDTSCATPRHA